MDQGERAQQIEKLKEGCGQPIDPARLEAVPETTLCLKCKMMTEGGVYVRTIAAQQAYPVQAVQRSTHRRRQPMWTSSR